MTRAFRQLLTQHYSLMDKYNDLHNTVHKGMEGNSSTAGPSTSRLLGLPILPSDPQSLADGAVLRFSKKDGMFRFS